MTSTRGDWSSENWWVKYLNNLWLFLICNHILTSWNNIIKLISLLWVAVKTMKNLYTIQKNITIEILVLCPFLPVLIFTDSFNLAWVDENHWFIWNCWITGQPHFTVSANWIVIVWDKDTKYAVWYLICGV